MVKFEAASGEFRFAAAVAAYGMILRDSEYKGTADLTGVEEWADAAGNSDEYRSEFKDLVRLTKRLKSSED